jgi:glutathione S-transferase
LESLVAASEPRLITLSISPFNELARWSLAHAGVSYREEPQGLVIHTIASRRVGGNGTTPVLVADDEVVPESAEIAEFADRRAAFGRRLFPEGADGQEVRELVRRFGEELGPASRRVIWRHLIHDIDFACRYWQQGLSPRQARWQPRMMKLARPMAKRAMKLDAQELEAAPGIVRSYFEEVAERLADGGRIVGDSITAADISFASMASPAILPDQGYPVRLPQPEDFPEDVARTIRELRALPAGQYALRLYREERRASGGA